MEEMLTIRPQPKWEESLTSYLCRIAVRNEISFLEIWKLVNTGPKSKVQNIFGYKLDIFPHEVINASTLAKLLCTSNSQIEDMTFYPLIKKFFNNHESVTQVYNYFMKNHIIKEKRRFCPKCLKEKGFFKLIWQVREIEICDIHHVSLKSLCNNCLREQPYISKSLAFCECYYCQTALKTENEEVVNNEVFIMDQLQKYENWRYILHPTTELVTEKEIDGLTKEKTLAIKLLFVAQGQQPKLKWSSVKSLSRDKVRNFTGLVCDRTRFQKVFIADLFHVLRTEHLSVERFVNIMVQSSYIQSFQAQIQEKEPGFCLTPWCSDGGTRKMIIELSGDGHHLKYKHRYSSAWICSSCFMRYGFSRYTNQWGNIANEIQVISEVLNFLELGLTREKIREELKLGVHRANEIFGYLLYHELLSDHYVSFYRPKSQRNLIVENFDEIKNCARNAQYMYNVARRLFNWDQVTFYYYYASREFKALLIKESSKRKQSVVQKAKRHREAKLSIDEMVQNNVGVTVKELAHTLDLSEGTIRYHGINVTAKEINQDQRESNLQQEQVKLVDAASEYVKLMNEKGEPIYSKDIYKYLDRSRKFIRKNFPLLYQWISEQIRLSKIYQDQKKNESIMALIRTARDKLIMAGEKVTVKAVYSKMGLSYNIFNHSKYRKMYSIIKEEMNI